MVPVTRILTRLRASELVFKIVEGRCREENNLMLIGSLSPTLHFSQDKKATEKLWIFIHTLDPRAPSLILNLQSKQTGHYGET